MKVLSLSDFKAHMSKRLRDVQAGEHIVLTQYRRPIAEVVPIGGEDLIERRPSAEFVIEPRARLSSFSGSALELLSEERGPY